MCHGPYGCTVVLGVKVKVKVTCWDWDRELLTRCTLGLVTEVHHGPGVYCGPPDVYRGPPEVYRGPCMKNMAFNCPITYTVTEAQVIITNFERNIYQRL